jgi:hypothetical protein
MKTEPETNIKIEKTIKKKRNIIESSDEDEKHNDIKDNTSKHPKFSRNYDVCPVCLCSLSSMKYYATPDACDHVYCVDCLEEWSKVRLKFYLIKRKELYFM